MDRKARWFGRFALCLLTLLLLATDVAAQVRVRSYTRKDGTYVRSHFRSRPDGNFWNNWSTIGNTNPYTGEPGTKRTPPDGYGGRRYSPGYSSSPGASDYGASPGIVVSPAERVEPELTREQ